MYLNVITICIAWWKVPTERMTSHSIASLTLFWNREIFWPGRKMQPPHLVENVSQTLSKRREDRTAFSNCNKTALRIKGRQNYHFKLQLIAFRIKKRHNCPFKLQLIALRI